MMQRAETGNAPEDGSRQPVDEPAGPSRVKHPTGVRRVLLRIVLTVTGGSLLLAVLILAAYHVISFRNSMAQDLMGKASIVGLHASFALIHNDTKDAEQTLSALGSAPSIKSAALYTRTGDLFAAYRRDRGNGIPAKRDPGEKGVTMGFMGISVVQPIVVQNQVIGSLEIRSDLQDLQTSILFLAVTAGSALTVSFVLSAVLLRRLQRRITDPILDLVDIMKNVSKERKYGSRTVVGGIEEMRYLSEGFNEMLEQIQRRDMELELHRQQLETAVAERTQELARANEDRNRELAEKTRAEAALRESWQQYQSLVESTDDSIYLVDHTYRYRFMNRQHLQRLGIGDGEYVGKHFGDFHAPEETVKFVARVERVFNTGKSFQDEYRSRRDDRYFLQTFSPVRDQEGATVAVTVISKDITELKIMERALRSLSLTDELTGLYNRRGFMTLVDQILKLARRERRGLFLLYADLDNLKVINDTQGHTEGDRALSETARLLRENYRDSDIIGRIGGDEFVIVPVGVAGDSVSIISSRFEKIFEEYNAAGIRKYDLSISYGIAYYDPEAPCSIEELLSKADVLMYEQKRKKKMSAV